MNKQIKFDAKQLGEVLNQFKPGVSRLWTFERALEALKVLGIIAAGIWTIYLYNDGERQRGVLTLEQVKLQNVRDALDYELAQQKKKVSEQGVFTLDEDLKINQQGKDSLIEAVLGYRFANNGGVIIKVSRVIVEWYVGKLKPGALSTGLAIENLPPVGVLQRIYPATPGPIVWEKVGYKACVLDESAGSNDSWMYPNVQFQVGSCGTDKYQPGFSTQGGESAVVDTKDLDFVGATIYVLFGPNGNERYRFNTFAQRLQKDRLTAMRAK
jgi:hypothetical protein